MYMKKKKNVSTKDKSNVINFVPLYPQYDKNNKIYVDRLLEAIKDDKILNIGLTGPYGAGKSSILSEFYRNLKKENKYLTISLATLNNNDNKVGVLNNIEIGILQQLIYKVSSFKIPFSKIPRIKDTVQNISSAFISLIIYVLGLDFIDKMFSFFGRITKIGFEWCKPLDTILHILPIIIIFFAVKNMLNLITITSVTVKGIKIEENKDDNESILNKYIDEILYFFKKTQYKIVIFEDIDRFNNVEIFYKLREINKLLNDNSEIAKKGNIKFIYAVKDNILNNPEDRTKFFDIIIPVIPIISSNNAQEKFIEALEKIGMKNIVSLKTIQDVSYFVKDMRLVTNICNEFKVFYEKIYTNISNWSSFSIDKLFVIVAYKNINPLDYNNMQYDNGQINYLIDFKEYIKLSRNNQIIENNKEIERINNKKNQDIEDLKEEIITKYEDDSSYSNGEYYTKSDTFESIEEFSEKADIEEIFQYGVRGNTSNKFKTIDEIKKNNDYRERYKRICDVNLKRVEEYVNKNKELSIDINNQKLNILYKENETFDDIKKQIGKIQNIKEKENKLKVINTIVINKCLVYFIRNGYIGEDYKYYINNIYLDNISLNDYIYVANVKNSENKNFNIKLENVDIVNSKLNDIDFENTNILNINLLDYLLENEVKEKYRILKMCEQVSKELMEPHVFENQNFFSIFFYVTEHLERFIKYMCSADHDLWNKLEKYLDKEFIDKAMVGKCIVMYANDNDLNMILADSNIKNVLETDDEILQYSTEKELQKLNKVFNKNLKFKDISMSDKCCFSYIVENDMYYVSFLNISEILRRFYDSSFYDKILDNPFTKLLELNKKNLSNYLKKSVNSFIEEVTCKTNSNISNKEFINLLNCKPTDKNMENILNKFTGKIGNILEVEKCFWEKLLKYDRIVINIENLIEIYNEYGINESLAIHINNNCEKLSKEIRKMIRQNKEISHELIEILNQLIYSYVIENDNLIILLKACKKFRIDNVECSKIDELRLISLINNKLIEFSKNNYINIKEYYSNEIGNFCRVNIKNFIKLYDDLDDAYNIIDTLIFTNISDKYKLILLEKKEYDISVKNSYEANIFLELINKSTKYNFDFDTLLYKVYNLSNDDNIKIDFINNYFQNFSFNQIDNLIECLDSKKYRDISRLNSSRPTFDENDKIIQVLKKLKEIDYINLTYNSPKYKVTKKKLKSK